MKKQKTAHSAGALIDDAKKWKAIDWQYVRRQVRRLQVRIAKAVKEIRWNKVKALQYLLTRSFYAKLLAVKRVTSNIRSIIYGISFFFRNKRAASFLISRSNESEESIRTLLATRNAKGIVISERYRSAMSKVNALLDASWIKPRGGSAPTAAIATINY